MNKVITVADIITPDEAKELMAYVKAKRDASEHSVHNLCMKWLDRQPKVLQRLKEHGVIKAYAAYLLEYHLKLS